nr:MAG TPA: hypothetical protein [Caudoviricetes sp.]
MFTLFTSKASNSPFVKFIRTHQKEVFYGSNHETD